MYNVTLLGTGMVVMGRVEDRQAGESESSTTVLLITPTWPAVCVLSLGNLSVGDQVREKGHRGPKATWTGVQGNEPTQLGWAGRGRSPASHLRACNYFIVEPFIDLAAPC